MQIGSYKSVFEKHGDNVEALLKEEWEKWNDPKSGCLKTSLFRHQIAATMNTKTFLLDETKPKPALIIAPTGSGKTGMLCLLPYLMKSKNTLILTPSPLLSDQITQAMAFPGSFFEKITFFDKSETEDQIGLFLPPYTLNIKSTDNIQKSNCQMVIVNVQKLGGTSKKNAGREESEDPENFEKVTKFFRSFDLLLVDEAHHFPAPTWYNIKKRYEEENPSGHMVFVTATVNRMVNNKLERILPKEHESYVVTNEELEST